MKTAKLIGIFVLFAGACLLLLASLSASLSIDKRLNHSTPTGEWLVDILEITPKKETYPTLEKLPALPTLPPLPTFPATWTPAATPTLPDIRLETPTPSDPLVTTVTAIPTSTPGE